MKTLQISDSSTEIRVEIRAALTGSLVEELQETWESSQSNQFWRRFVVDISAMTGYDTAGHALLHRLHSYGAIFAAGTPRSLEYLEEIHSGAMRAAVPLQIRRPADRALSPRARHKSGLRAFEAGASSR